MKCKFLQPEEFSDHRGVIKSFYPDEAVVEYNLMTINKGSSRGFHYHPHFNEYMMVVHGEGYELLNLNQNLLKIQILINRTNFQLIMNFHQN